ncbi:MAG: hypothetical protein MPK08_04700 [Alphaproteobacteria bacterium]|nr:hypothetical protein [Alphaproteobacteria bacterium]
MRRVVSETFGWVAGEIAPSFHGREDLSALRHGAARLENLVVEAGGSLRRRPGTKFLRHDEGEVRVIPLPPKRVKVSSFDSRHDERSVGERYFRALRFLRFPPEMARAYALRDGAGDLRIPRVLHLRASSATARASEARILSALEHYAPARLANIYRDSHLDIDIAAHELAGLQHAHLGAGVLVVTSGRDAPRIFREKEPQSRAGLEYIPGVESWKLLWTGGHSDIVRQLYPHGERAEPTPPLFRPDGMKIKLTSRGQGRYRAEFSPTAGWENWHETAAGHHFRVGESRLTATGFVNTRGDLSVSGGSRAAYVDLVSVATSQGRTTSAPETGKWLDDWSMHAFGPGLGWPSAVAFHDGRLVLASDSRLWMSRVGEPFNFDTGYSADGDQDAAALASSAIDLRLPRGETICGVVSANELEIYTTAGEWAVVGDPITPATARLRRIGDTGSRLLPHPVQPVRAEGMTLFVDKNGAPAGLRWSSSEQQHRAVSLTGMAPHLASDFVRLCWQRENRRLLGLRSDGVIACATWIAEEEVLAWTRWTLNYDARASSTQVAALDPLYAETGWTFKRQYIGPAFADLAGDGAALFAVSARRPMLSLRESKPSFGRFPPAWSRHLSLRCALMFCDGIDTDFTQAPLADNNTAATGRAAWQSFWHMLSGRLQPLPAIYYAPPGVATEMVAAVEDEFLMNRSERARAGGSRVLPYQHYMWELPRRHPRARMLRLYDAETSGYLWTGTVVLSRLEPLPLSLGEDAGVGVVTGLRIRPVELVLKFRRARHRAGGERAFGFATANGDLGLVEFGGRMVAPEIFAGLGQKSAETEAGIFPRRLPVREGDYRSRRGEDLPSEIGTIRLDEFLAELDWYCGDSGGDSAGESPSEDAYIYVSDYGVDSCGESAVEVRVRGLGWISGGDVVWGWFQPFLHSAELVSVTLEARVGDI